MWRDHFTGLLTLVSLYLFQGICIMAQNSPVDGNITISEVLEEKVSDNDEDSDPVVIADEMYYFLDHPLNINTATDEELRQLHLLTEFQIFSLISYIQDHGELLSVNELQLVYGFDLHLISNLLPFIIVSPQKMLTGNHTLQKKHFRQNLLIRAGFDGIKKAGFIPDSIGNKEFTGKNRALLVRYEAGISRFNTGFTIDQDAGESFTSGGKSFNPDFMSAFLEYKGQGPVKKIIIGDYKISCGQGLVLGGYGLRKGAQVLLSPQATGIKKYSSAGENDFFRGVAGSLHRGNISTEIFASRMRIDAGLHELTNDTSTILYFSSPDASGLHRSIAELRKKDAVIINSFGGHSQISRNKIVWGFSYLNQQYSHPWIRNTTAYAQEIFPSGINLQNIGSDFKVSLGKMAVFGEIAADTKARVAVFAGTLAELHPLIRLSLAYRNYKPDYLGIKSSGFGESQGTKNEEGFYLGLQMFPWKYLKVDLYADHYSFPFLRYNSTNPYSGNDYLLNLVFYPTREFIINMRFRYEKTQNRSQGDLPGINHMETIRKGSYRLEMNYELNENLKLKSRIEFSYFQTANDATTIGFYSGHDMGFASNSQKIKIWLRYALYDIPGWDNRIYAYENDVLYSFSVPAFNSKGARIIAMGKADIFPGCEVSIRYAVSQFQGIKKWGSGNDKVESGIDSYFTLQLRFKI